MPSVLVTGGTVRIGKAIAEHLASRGWRVITSSHRADSGADIVCDLRGKDAAVELFAKAVAMAGGRLDAIVNNAALFTGTGEELTKVNLDAPMQLTDLLATQGGAVVHILDARELEGNESVRASVAPCARMATYSAGKRALAKAVRASARRLAPHTRVNGVAPGPVMVPTGMREKAGAMLVKRPTVEDAAAAVAFLLETPSVTGVIIPVDGGQHLV